MLMYESNEHDVANESQDQVIKDVVSFQRSMAGCEGW